MHFLFFSKREDPQSLLPKTPLGIRGSARPAEAYLRPQVPLLTKSTPIHISSLFFTTIYKWEQLFAFVGFGRIKHNNGNYLETVLFFPVCFSFLTASWAPWIAGQTDPSNHFFIKHLSEINLRFQGKRGAPAELQGGEESPNFSKHPPLCRPEKYPRIHRQPENTGFTWKHGHSWHPPELGLWCLALMKLSLFASQHYFFLFQDQKGRIHNGQPGSQFNFNNSSTGKR